MLSITALLIIVIVLALAFDFINGFHDTANAIATSVSTRALKPQTAVMLAAVLNFAGAMAGTAVAKTIGKGIVETSLVNMHTLTAAMLGAIFWNLLTWYYGFPSSSSHALIGGLVGAAIASGGWQAVIIKGFTEKVLLPLVLSPIIGYLIGFTLMTVFYWIFGWFAPGKVNNVFRRLQILSAMSAAFSHGSNDAQKTMGIIALALFSAQVIPEFTVPIWVKAACALAMGLGTAAGGWRIIKTMGSKIFKMEPIHGFAADVTSSTVIYGASLLGVPVSTTHVVSSSILGVGSAKRFSAVNWQVAINIITAWFLTIPASGLVAYLTYWLIKGV
ncbi:MULTISPECIES: inorganic phosphate transporter [Carboxydocella]|uniref:Inorganic phosphate transporter, PiT family n=2 Tax=Carboxydocella TaxID=178898 RepID=A0A1T4NX40_9FIRM|nr:MULTISPECIES: inorganic phosphate transporter [Carboxydocella]AVX20144.1 inorganic phosphate transporter, PiT family [Carboxydocella thermautotrophica]GAW30807.1 inorganic phosphate transporter [Carboxydocella sp. JDF658]SJZ83606.1 inorganic phosphate transporter, PiT family [Carboxydocella sporoproducens DSM 16521]